MGRALILFGALMLLAACGGGYDSAKCARAAARQATLEAEFNAALQEHALQHEHDIAHVDSDYVEARTPLILAQAETVRFCP